MKNRKAVERKLDKEVKERLEVLESIVEGYRTVLKHIGAFDMFLANKRLIKDPKAKKRNVGSGVKFKTGSRKSK